MKHVSVVAFLFVFASIIFGQDRASALEEFTGLKKRAALLESIVLLPDRRDLDVAAKENVSVMRLLPRETYDNSYASIRGGGAFYSFYFRYHDYGYGSDVMLEQNSLSSGSSGLGILTDLGDVPLSEITTETKASLALTNYQKVKYGDYQEDRSALVRGVKTGETMLQARVTAAVGHTYLLRSAVYDYYDIIVAFKIYRKDPDGSLIILWKMLDQFNTPSSGRATPSVVLNDAEMQKRITEMNEGKDTFSAVRAGVTDGVVSLRGAINKKDLPYLIQLVNRMGATKIVNSMDVK